MVGGNSQSSKHPQQPTRFPYQTQKQYPAKAQKLGHEGTDLQNPLNSHFNLSDAVENAANSGSSNVVNNISLPNNNPAQGK